MRRDNSGVTIECHEIPILQTIYGWNRHIPLCDKKAGPYLGGLIALKLMSVVENPDYPDKSLQSAAEVMLDGYFGRPYKKLVEVLEQKQEKLVRRKQNIARVVSILTFKGLNHQGQLARDVSG